MQKKQDGKIVQHKLDAVKLVIKLERMLNDLEELQKAIIENWTILGSTARDRLMMYRPRWFLVTPIEYGNHLDIKLVPLNSTRTSARAQETTMWYNNEEDVTAQSKNYFLREINTIVTKKQEEAAKRFGLNDPKPKTLAEAVEWLKTGKFRIGDEDHDLNDFYYHSAYQLTDWLHWIDPTVVRDEDGYNQYVAKLSEETKRIERIVVACRLDAEGYDYDRDNGADYNVIIDAIEELEKWDWTPPAKVIPLVATSD